MFVSLCEGAGCREGTEKEELNKKESGLGARDCRQHCYCRKCAERETWLFICGEKQREKGTGSGMKTKK